ncbi:GNAT family N-acetyltransferase, partial [Clostridium saudiense]|nr:GNAT family N-acetyltransferase [Clostridium saudiense]
IERVVEDDSREDFIIFDLHNNILGEAVLMEIDDDNKSCHFRIAIFNKDLCGQGIGYKATLEVLRVAFEELKLHRVELEVFDYNLRAKKMYEKAGFKVEGLKRDGIFIENEFKGVYI